MPVRTNGAGWNSNCSGQLRGTFSCSVRNKKMHTGRWPDQAKSRLDKSARVPADFERSTLDIGHSWDFTRNIAS